MQEEQTEIQLPDRVIFGVVLRDADADTLDTVLDAIEGTPVSDADWEWLAWYRGESCYLILHAPIVLRGAIVTGVTGASVVPVGVVAAQLTDNRNDWVYPGRGARPAVERAQDALNRWQQGMWQHDTGVPEVDRVDEVEEGYIPDLSRRKARSSRLASSRQQAREEVLAAFGLLGARDSEGREFKMSTLAPVEGE